MISSDRTQAMIEQISRLNPFTGAENLPDPPRPEEKLIPRQLPSGEQIPYIQKLLEILSYNHLPHTFFSLEKHRSLQSILHTAKEVLAEALPIRCLEATFVGLYLTQDLADVYRIPLSFKSEANGSFYRHIVLVVHVRSPSHLFGALGLSRKDTLMYKPLQYASLYDIVMDYKKEYKALGHTLVDIKLGLPVSHDHHSRFNPCWRFIALKLETYLRDSTPFKLAAAVKTPSIVFAEGETGTNPLIPSSDLWESPGDVSNSRQPFAEGVVSARNGGSRTNGPISSPTSADSASLATDDPQTAADLPPALVPVPSITTAESEGGASQADHSEGGGNPLSRILDKYSSLLTIISEQYEKGLPTLDTLSKASRLCFLDLDEAERDAGVENQRRVRYINSLQSPLTPEARKLASTRLLKAPKEKDKEKPARAKSRKRSRSKKRSRTVTRKHAVTPRPDSTNGSASPTRSVTECSPSAATASPAATAPAVGFPVTSVPAVVVMVDGSPTSSGLRVGRKGDASSSSPMPLIGSELFSDSNKAESQYS